MAWYFDRSQRLDVTHLLGRLPELKSIAEVETVPFRRFQSPAITTGDWLDLLRTAQTALADERIHGLVITHGTNTLEETACFLDLTLRTEKPVVIVGAMRPASALSSDGDLNLLNAVRVAAAAESAGQSVLVVLNDSIFAARDVTKAGTYRLHAFESRDSGPLGYADADGQVIFYRRQARKHALHAEFRLDAIDALPRVDVLVSYVGADGALIDAAVAAGARGIVSAGTGAGLVAPDELAALERAQQRGVAICQSSRVGSGRVVARPSLVQRRFIAAGNLLPWKSRVLLALSLTVTTDPEKIQWMFDRY
jgi:L-asparaginase